MKLTRFIAGVSMVVLGFLALLVPGSAQAQVPPPATCNGFVNIDYVNPPAAPVCGDELTVKISFGTGSITGTAIIPAPPPFMPTDLVLSATAFSFFLACADASFPCTLPLPGLIAFVPGSESDTCPGITFTGTVSAADPNRVDFVASPTNLVMPPLQPDPPGVCNMTFRIKILNQNPPPPAAPQPIDESVGYTVAICNNGNLVSSGAQSSSVTPSCTTSPDFNCYQDKKAINFDPTNPDPVDPISSLADMFGKYQNVQLSLVKRMCSPANKSNQAPTDTEHLVGYNVSSIGSSTFTPAKVLVHNDQFGDLTADVDGVTSRVPLLVPSNKNKGTTKNFPPIPPPLVNPTLSHFFCYDMKNVKGANGSTLPTGVPVVTDQFGTQALTFLNVKKWRLCAATNKNNQDPAAETSTTGLLCYVAEGTPNPVKGGLKVSWINQIEPKGNMDKLDNIDDFCVISTITKQ